MKSKTFTSPNGNQYRINTDGELFTIAKRGGRGRGKVGDWYQIKGTKRGRGYLDARIGGKIFPIHRIVAQHFIDGYTDGSIVDHINGDPSDNRLQNLRILSHKQNMRAYNKPTNGAKSKYRGVWWHKANRKWVAEIRPNNQKIHIGCYSDELEAAKAFNTKALELGWPKESLNQI